MKNLTLIAVLLFLTLYTKAAILVVDNVPGNGAPYTSVQTAINAALAGDTIMVQPSPTSYGSITLSKMLVIIGPGYYPEDRNTARLGIVTLYTGSSGTILTGLHMDRVTCGNAQVIHNISIIRNYIFGSNLVYGTSGSSDNWLIEGNILEESTACGGCRAIDIFGSSNNWTFRNNVIMSASKTATSTRLFNNLNQTTLVVHNIIIHRNPGDLFGGTSWGSASNDALFQNNIIWTDNANANMFGNCNNCQWVHNLTFSPNGTLPTLTGTNNLDNTNPQFLQIPSATNASFAFDNDYHCAPASPGATGASDNGMLGVFGGNYPFRNYCEPTGIPRMLEMILDNVIMEIGNNSTVRVKAVGGAQ